MQISQEIQIPPLREDLKVFRGEYDLDGAPTWMLYDPLSDNYFKIGWFEFECLQRFERCKTGTEMLNSIKRETALNPDMEELKEFMGFLLLTHLLRANSKEIQNILYEEKERREASQSFIKNVLGKYLFITIPLFQPEKFLKKAYPYVEKLFTRKFLVFILGLLGLGIFLTIQRWDVFINTFTLFLSLEGILCIILSTIFVKSVHELGHAFMAYKYKIPIPSMGIVLIFFYPVLYTETTGAWRLYHRKKRINIAAAGLMAELMLASVFLIFWHLLSPSLLQNAVYFIAFVSLTLSFLVNLNFFMKFDGYYVLSDMIGIDNLQSRAISFFKWKFRETLFSLGQGMPETVSTKIKNFLIYFGISLSIYRVFLYLGISLAAYHFMFKPFGFFVMLTVLGWFLGMPIINEVIMWFKEKELFFKNKRSKVVAGIAFGLFFLACLPIHRTLKIPVVAHAENYSSIYSNFPAKIEKIYIENGQNVKKGDVLFELSSPSLEYKTKQAKLNLELYKKIRERQQALPELASENNDIEQTILEAQTRLDGFNNQKKQLKVVAPFDGVILDLDLDREIHVGRSINTKHLLARVINEKQLGFTGYVRERDISRIKKGAMGHFLPEVSFTGRLDVELVEVSENNSKFIQYPELSSLFGGDIPGEASDRNEDEIVPLVTIFTLNFQLSENYDQKIGYIQKGIVHIDAKPISFIGEVSKKFISIFIRETGL